MKTPSTAMPVGTLIAAMATVGVCDVAFGLTFQLQPLILEAMGIPAWIIGINAAMGPLGILLIGPFLPRIIAGFGGKRVALVAILTIIASLSAMAVVPPLYWWFPLRFFLGMATGSLFTVSETWMLTLANPNNRGRIMGIYTSMLSVTFAIGPMALPFTGTAGYLPWVICIVFVVAGLVPLLLVNVREAHEDGGRGNMFAVLQKAPLLFLGIGTATLFDSVFISFFTIFATRRGVPLETASFMLGAGIVAGVVFFYPLGLWADRWSKHGVIVLCTVASIISSLALIPLISTIWIWPLVLLVTTAAFGVYVVALALIGDVFKGNDVVAASAAVAAMWGVGGIIGPPTAGWMIDNFGINALPATLAVFYTVLLVALLLNRGRVVSHANTLPLQNARH